MSDNEGSTNPVDYQVKSFLDHLDRNDQYNKVIHFKRTYILITSLIIPLDYEESLNYLNNLK